MALNKLTKLLFIVSFSVFLFGAGFKLGEYGNRVSLKNGSFSVSNLDDARKNQNLDFSLFWDTWEKLEEKFVDKKRLDPQKMFYGAIKGMVASVDDPYTFFLTPEENKLSKDDLEGKFEGIGAQLGLKNGRIVVIAPLKKSPAEKAGVKAGDAILKVDGKSTEKWTLFEAVSKIRGEKGTKVILTLERDEKEIDAEIIRDEINVPSVELEVKRGVAILKLARFGDDTTKEWDKAISQIARQWKGKTVKAMILDLRDNPGGYLDGSVYIASEFIAEGKLVVKQEYNNGTYEEHKVKRGGMLLDIPLVVLINKGSASASEIVAGALRDYKRAKLIGEKTFGKGSIQEALDLKKGAGLHVTIAKWILPNGDWINDKGVEPTIKIENPTDEKNTITPQSDKQLEKAIEDLI